MRFFLLLPLVYLAYALARGGFAVADLSLLALGFGFVAWAAQVMREFRPKDHVPESLDESGHD